jgi:hypothetical protein
MNWIKEQAFSNTATDQRGNTILSPAKLDRAIKRLDADGRLETIFGKQGAQHMRDLNDLAKVIYTTPPGAVNHSNTASVLLAAMAEAGATSAFTGLPVPVLSTLRWLQARQESPAPEAHRDRPNTRHRRIQNQAAGAPDRRHAALIEEPHAPSRTTLQDLHRPGRQAAGQRLRVLRPAEPEPDQTAPVTVYWDAAGTIPAAQPLRTVNGYIMRGGTPANVFFDGVLLRAGAGLAPAPTLQDKNRSVFYGAKADGVTDDTRAFYKALAAIRA